MPIRFKLLFGCLLLTAVTVSLGLLMLRGERQLADLAMRTYDEALISISFTQGAATKFEVLRGQYALAARAPGGADAAPFDTEAASDGFDDVADELGMVVERAAKGAGRDAAAVLKARVKDISATASDVAATLDRLNQAAPAFKSLIEEFSQESFDYRTYGSELIASARHHAIIGIGASVLAALLITAALTATIVPGVRRATKAALAIADGRLDEPIKARKFSRSETTNLLRALGQMQSAIRDQLQRIASLNAEEAAQRARIEAERTQNEAARQAAATAQQAVVTSIALALEQLAAGDLTIRVNDTFDQSYEAIRANFNAAAAQLERVVQGISRSASDLNAGTGDIARAADDLRHRSEQQAAALEQTAAAVTEVTTRVRATANGANHARTVMAQTVTDAAQAGTVVIRAAEAMTKVEQSAEEISQIIGIIDGFSFQTMLLALNATLEAARAGDAGRGFGVVAAEVRTLAQRSAAAANNIKSLIADSSGRIAESAALVKETAEALRRITDQTGGVNTAIKEIAQSNEEQATTLREVMAAISQVNSVTQQNAAMVEESTAATHLLASQTNELQRLTARFQVSRPNAVKPPAARAA